MKVINEGREWIRFVLVWEFSDSELYYSIWDDAQRESYKEEFMLDLKSGIDTPKPRLYAQIANVE